MAPYHDPPHPAEERLAAWDGKPTERLAREWGVPELLVYRRVGSTNDVARRLAEQGCPSGTCVLAEEQTAGRGREARSWLSPPGLGIWLSLVLRPRDAVAPGGLPLVIGLAVARGLDPYCGQSGPRIKWPNDLLLDGRKLGGILCEGLWSAGHLHAVIAGIGLNVLHAPADFPPDLAGSATSLRIATRASPRRRDVAGAVVQSVLGMAPEWALDERSLAELRRRDALRDREVVVAGAGAEPVRGVALGISPDGDLLVRTAEGPVRGFRSGTVRLCSPPSTPPSAARAGAAPADARVHRSASSC